jgi:hypothetical protein
MVQKIKNIATGFLAFLTMIAFMVSTTGITYFTHECKHHEVQRSLVAIDDCCSAKPASKQEKSHDCCSMPEPEEVNVCHSGPEEGTCCVTHLNYFRLATSFLQSQQEQFPQDIFLFMPIFSDDLTDLEEYTSNYIVPVPEIEKPPPLLYRLYHCQRIAPPLS